MSWELKTLDELGNIGRGRSRHRPRDAEHLYGGSYPFIQTGDVKHSGLYITNFTQTYSEAGLAQSKLWQAGTLCITIAANIADTAILGIDACFPDSIIGFTPYPEKADIRFVKYLFDAQLKQKLQQFTQGAAQDNLSQEKLLSIKFLVPEIPEQNKIADIISAYDDLIENNRRRIQLLERSLYLLYKEWFVHLRFPSHEHSKIVDGIPEGWERKPFSHLADFINGFAFKPEHLGDQGLPIVKIPELRDGITSKTPRNLGDIVPDKNYLYTGDILFSWSGTILVNIWNHGEALLNQHLFKVVPKHKELYGFVYIALQNSLILFANETTGATMKHFRRSALDNVSVAVPNTTLLKQFDDTVSPVLSQISNLQRQTTKLQQARDLLLPKLMSGAIGV